MHPDPYTTLGIGRSASPDDIKRAFHRLAHKYHPDKPTGNAEEFKKISAAYAELKDRPAQAPSPDDIMDDVYAPQGGFTKHYYNSSAFTARGFTQADIDRIVAEWTKNHQQSQSQKSHFDQMKAHQASLDEKMRKIRNMFKDSSEWKY